MCLQYKMLHTDNLSIIILDLTVKELFFSDSHFFWSSHMALIEIKILLGFMKISIAKDILYQPNCYACHFL